MNHIKIYLEYAKTNVHTFMEYKFDFLIGISAMLLSNIASLLFIWVLFQHVTSINGWTFPQMLFLNGMAVLTFGIWHTFTSGVWNLERFVKDGILDRLLARPLNILFQLIATRLDDDGIGDIIAGVAVLFISSSMLGIVWSLERIFYFIIFTASGLVILVSIALVPASVAFWTVKSRSILWTIFRFQKFSELPLEIYSFPVVFLISVILPFAFVNYYPAQIFLGKGMYMEFAWLSPLVAAVSFAVAYSFWKFGLRHYTSTGS